MMKRLLAIAGKKYKNTGNALRGSRNFINAPWKELIDLISRCRKDPGLDPFMEITKLAFKSSWQEPSDLCIRYETYKEGISQYEHPERDDIRYWGAIITVPADEFIEDPEESRHKYVYDLFLKQPARLSIVENNVIEFYEVIDSETNDLHVMIRIPFVKI